MIVSGSYSTHATMSTHSLSQGLMHVDMNYDLTVLRSQLASFNETAIAIALEVRTFPTISDLLGE